MENNINDILYENILEDTDNNVIESEDMPNSLRRTVWLIQDEEDDETYTADEILDDKHQSQLFDIRHSLYAAYKSGEYKLVCKQCQQPLGLKIRTHEGDFFPFFSHFQNSGPCPLKNQIEIDPIQSIQSREKIFKSSSLYEQMLERLKEVLESSKSFENVEESKVITKPEIKGYRKPAIYSTHQEKEVCFDLLVSNPLISLLVGRNAFYKLHKMFYLWLFPSFTTKHQRLCQKDILYMNRRNVFVFDCKEFYNKENKEFCEENTNSSDHQYAYEESIRQNRLMLNCYWQTPEVIEINGKSHISIKWNGPKLVAFEDLVFDYENYELYYHDSDEDFYNLYPIEIQRQIDEWLKIKKDRWSKIFDSIEKRKILYAQLMAKRERKERLKYYYSLIEDGEAEPELYYDEESKLYGYRIDGFDIIPPMYYDSKPFYCGFAWVRKKERWGVIDIYNRKVANFQYSIINDLESGTFYAYKNQKFILVDFKGEQKGDITFSKIEILKSGLYKIANIIVTGYDRGYYPGSGFYNFKKTKTLYGIINGNGKEILPCKFDSVGSFEDGRAEVTIDSRTGFIDEVGNEEYEISERGNVLLYRSRLLSKFGLMDCDKNKLTAPVYDFMGDFVDGVSDVYIKEGSYTFRHGILSETGELIIECNYNTIQRLCNNLFALYKNGISLQFINGEVLEGTYSNIGYFNENFICVKQMDKWGIINYRGEIVIPCVYSEIVEIEKDCIRVKLNSYSNIAEIDWDGNEIYEIESVGDVKIYHSRLLYKSGLMDMNNIPLTGLDFNQLRKFNNNLFIASKDGKYGLISKLGNMILSIDYDFIEVYNEEFAKIKKDKLWGVLNSYGEFILPYQYYDIIEIKDGIIKVKKGAYDKIGKFDLKGQEIFNYRKFGDVIVYESVIQKKSGLMDNEYNPITELIYDSIKDFKDGKALAKQGLYWGVINTQGQELIPFKFSEIGDFVEGKATAKIYEKGIIDTQGNEIYEFHHTEDLIIYESRLLKKFGLMTLTNNPITDLIYDQIPKFNMGFAIVSTRNKWGIINKSGDELISFQYDDLIETKNKNFVVRKNRKWGIINSSGHIITPIKYDRIIEKGEGIYCIREESYGYWGVVNDDNTFILPIKYDAIGDFTNGYLSVKKGKWWKKIKINKSASSNKENNYIDLSKLQEGVVYNAVSTGFTKFGVFIEIPNIGVGLIPAKEIYVKEKKLNDFKKGTKIKVLLQKKDIERNRASFKLTL